MTSAPNPRPVVAGLDGSGSARRAADLATEEVARRGAPLHLLHALSWPAGNHADPPSRRVDLPALVHSGAEALLRAAAADASAVLGADRVSWSIAEDHPVAALRLASRDAQLLVLGALGVGGIAGLVLGSTASGVVSDAGCPVVVLPDDTSVVVRNRSSVVVGVGGAPATRRCSPSPSPRRRLARPTWWPCTPGRTPLWRPRSSPSACWSTGPGCSPTSSVPSPRPSPDGQEKEPDVVVREVVVRDRTARVLLAAGLTAQLLVVAIGTGASPGWGRRRTACCTGLPARSRWSR